MCAAGKLAAAADADECDGHDDIHRGHECAGVVVSGEDVGLREADEILAGTHWTSGDPMVSVVERTRGFSESEIMRHP